jgi:uncharacterized protein
MRGPCVLGAAGHAAGVISRLDRQRGAHHTPANAPMWDAVSTEPRHAPADIDELLAMGINFVRPVPTRGISLWGGRTLHDPNDLSSAPAFLAHQRLRHRLVRAMRRIAQALVFDINGPQLWLMLTRALTGVLLQAWRSGALMGATPQEAFQVRCDDETNPPSARDEGRCHCTVAYAPAVPMEFITLIVTLNTSGELEVFDP